VDGPWVVDFYLKPEFLVKSFRENVLPGGRSAGIRRTVRGDLADGPRGAADGPLFVTERGAARWTGRPVRGPPADSPHGPGGRSAWPWRTVRPTQRAVPPAVDFAFLPLEFKRGQSTRALRTVREACVLFLTASNGKGGIYVGDSPRGPL
jgi:hypothetical protein